MTQETIIPVTDNATFAAFCARMAAEPYITVDTEFMRERTYYPNLCLVQVAGANEAVIIDALVELDWSPFWELMQNKKVLKVFHAPRQDIEIFVKLSGHVPVPIFDTQIAAMACGFPDQVSYAKLAEAFTGKTINKQEQFTDWTARPLRPAQLTYALQDVTILREVYEGLQGKLTSSRRHLWLAEEMAALETIDTYRVNPDEAWERLKMRSNRPSSWAALKALAAWREHEAMRMNRPRQMILKDDVLTQLAMSVPTTAESLAKTRGLPNHLGTGVHAEKLVALLVQAKQVKADMVPQRKDAPNLNASQEDQLELIKMALKIIARQHNVSPKLIANGDSLTRLVLEDQELNILKGWRFDVFGKIAQQLLNGDIGLRMKDGRLALEE